MPRKRRSATSLSKPCHTTADLQANAFQSWLGIGISPATNSTDFALHLATTPAVATRTKHSMHRKLFSSHYNSANSNKMHSHTSIPYPTQGLIVSTRTITLSHNWITTTSAPPSPTNPESPNIHLSLSVALPVIEPLTTTTVTHTAFSLSRPLLYTTPTGRPGSPPSIITNYTMTTTRPTPFVAFCFSSRPLDRYQTTYKTRHAHRILQPLHRTTFNKN